MTTLFVSSTKMMLLALSCGVGSMASAQAGMFVARATDRHLTCPAGVLRRWPLIVGPALTSLLLATANNVSGSIVATAILLGAIGAADIEHHVIPDVLVIALAIVGIVAHPLYPEGSWIELTIGAAIVYFGGCLFLLAADRLGRGQQLGRGDIKMIAAIAANVSAIVAAATVLLGCIAALTFWGIALRRKSLGLPLGPFLAFACATVPAWPPL